MSAAYWQQPMKWNAKAAAAGVRKRVFCASMADVFEHGATLDVWRSRLWALIGATPQLDWLLLTKRPQNILRMSPWHGDWPANVWVGTTVENQAMAKKRLKFLERVPAVVRFVSCEPLLGHVDLMDSLRRGGVNWVIAGGESGPKSRPSNPDWFRALRDQCLGSGVPFHFKQWGDWGIVVASEGQDGTRMARVGKRTAGRTLDGQHWDLLPNATYSAKRTRVACLPESSLSSASSSARGRRSAPRAPSVAG